jgi:hypothetical protein
MTPASWTVSRWWVTRRTSWAAHRTGPRGGQLDPAALDEYDNLILLCKIHHKLIDDQHETFIADFLRTLKHLHEQWVRDRLEQTSDSHTVVRPLTDGRALWALLDGALSMSVESLDEGAPGVDEPLADLADAFLQPLNDYLDVVADIHINGMSAIRQAQRTLGARLTELSEHGLVVLGGRRTLAVGGEPWPDAIFVITLACSLTGEPPDETEGAAGGSGQAVS